MATFVKQSVLVDVIFAQTKVKAIVKDVVLVFSFSILTALSAQISFWIGPVPISGQTFTVLLTGVLLGSIRGALSQIVYILIGLCGIPFWFAAGGAPGILRLLGPTGGYLIGFVFAAFIVGFLAERGWDRNIKTSILVMIFGNIVIYIFGLFWLARFIPLEGLLIAGFYPFILGDSIKILLAGSFLPLGWRVAKKQC